MTDITPQRWIGSLRGSRVATVYVNRLPDRSLSFVLGFAGAGDVRLIAQRDGNTLNLTTELAREQFGVVTIEHETLDHVSGTWQFIGGAEGVIDLARYSNDSPTKPDEESLPERIWDKERPIGAVTLYRADLERLISEMESLVPRPNITTVRAAENGQFIVERAENYLARKDFIDTVRTITISTAEQSNTSIRRIINIILNDDGSNQITVSSSDEIWTEAAASRIEKYTNQFVSRITGLFRKHGLNINAFILIAILIWMPDWPLIQRLVVFVTGVIVMLVIAKSHGLVPYNRVYLNPDQQRRPFAKELPGATLAVGAAVVTAALSSVPTIFEFSKQLISQLGAWFTQ